MLTLEKIQELVLVHCQSIEEGAGLSPLDGALIELGLAASVTSLDIEALDKTTACAFDAGASPTQVQEILSMVSGLGVHTLMVSASRTLQAARDRGLVDYAPLDAAQAELWNDHVGEDSFWQGFEEEVPGFLKALLLLSPDAFRAFFEYCSVPWKTRSVSALTKELAAMACDATPAHMFLPGIRLHLANAIKLGAGRKQILQTLELARNAPVHSGVA